MRAPSTTSPARVAPSPTRMPDLAAFYAVAAILALFMAAASVPSPLYVVYQHEWGFSAVTLTIVFAVYVAGLLTALLIAGALSDHVGRRPVLALAALGEIAALVLFLLAGGVPMLLAARLVQGVATGAALSALSATLVDLNPPHAPARAGIVASAMPASGLAIGSLGSGALVQFAPAPTRLVYALLLAGTVLALVVVAVLPETSARKAGALASLAPRLGVPAHLRRELARLIPIIVASWSLIGLYLSLGPSVAASVFATANHLVGGIVVSLLCGAAGMTAVLMRKLRTTVVLQWAAALLAVGLAITLAGVGTGMVALAIAGTLVSGVGTGAALLASLGTLAGLVTPAERSELFAVMYLISYAALSIPAVIAGFAATAAGLRPTAIVYGIVVAGLAILAFAFQSCRPRAA